MKKIFFLGLLLSAATTFSQNWTLQYTDLNNSYYGVSFISSTEGWVCGQNGAILSSQNGGTSWTTQPSGTIQLLNTIHFYNQLIGKVAGNSGVIRITNDGGTTWSTPTSTGTNQSILSVQTTSADTAYYVDVAGRVGKTINGGQNWAIQAVSTNQLSDICFMNNEIGWVCGGNGTIYHTTNGGVTWTSQNSGTTDYLRKTTFINPLLGWSVGNSGRIINTIDGGTTWTTQTMPNNQGYTLRDVKFTSSTNGFIVGDMGIILKTTDSGVNWVEETGITTSNHFYSLSFPTSGTAFTAGTNNSNQGIVFNLQNTTTYEQENLISKDFYLYPNPATNSITIENLGRTTIKIINVIGQEILNKEVKNNDAIDISSFENGIYFLKDLSSGNTIKFIKQ